MVDLAEASALAFERSCAVTAVALSDARRAGARLVTGGDRVFSLDSAGHTVHVPYPVRSDWSRRTVTCGIALQCAPSKEQLAAFRLNELSARELRALTVVEGEVALGWIAVRWPGLVAGLRCASPGLEPADPDTTAEAMVRQAIDRATAGDCDVDPLVGRLPIALTAAVAWTDRVVRRFGRMPWTTTQKRMPQPYSVPVGGDGGVRNPNLPPPSRPADDDLDRTPEHRPGVPYPEWNAWTQAFLRDHVAVLEHARTAAVGKAATATADVRRWFEQHTHRAMANGLADGSDLDVDRYVAYHLDVRTGYATEPRVFRDLLPATRDVATALLLDGSSSLGVHGGRVFNLELACADALSHAMTRAREKHGVFVFTGNTRHRVEVTCLKDFADPRFVAPSGAGLVTGGYTRLGAPVRHLTSRLLAQRSERRLLIVIGDGMIADEGYEGRYAWADTAHAVAEANEAGVSVYYVGVGTTRVDPLPEVFGHRRSQRIRRIDELPRVLAHVHRELVSA